MADFDLIHSLVRQTDSRIVLLVLDGLGGIPHPETGRSELDVAKTPNLDRLARSSLTGLSLPVGHGITPGSGPGHLALFGYNPVEHLIGRGILEALGLEMEVGPGAIAARGNYCTLDDSGVIIDRRAGRMSTRTNQELSIRLGSLAIDGAEIAIGAGREHRLAVVFRPAPGSPSATVGFIDALTDNDPQREGEMPQEVTAVVPEAESTERVVRDFLWQAGEALRGSHPANGVVLRGFSAMPHLPLMPDTFRLNPAAIASYPMYRGLAKLVGMKVLQTGDTIEDEFETLRSSWNDHDFFFLHYKATDSAGEDGDYHRKVQALERLDRALPALLDLDPDVLIVAGDHSTPTAMAAHSWHPVPLMIRSRWSPYGDAEGFSERECARGILGTIPATEIMPVALATAMKLDKFGA